jgi:hypothetical protein
MMVSKNTDGGGTHTHGSKGSSHPRVAFRIPVAPCSATVDLNETETRACVAQ